MDSIKTVVCSETKQPSHLRVTKKLSHQQSCRRRNLDAVDARRVSLGHVGLDALLQRTDCHVQDRPSVQVMAGGLHGRERQGQREEAADGDKTIKIWAMHDSTYVAQFYSNSWRCTTILRLQTRLITSEIHTGNQYLVREKPIHRRKRDEESHAQITNDIMGFTKKKKNCD